jgi:hypothetical protein
MNPTHIHLQCVHATLRLGESTPEAIATECGLDVELVQSGLDALIDRGDVSHDNWRGYVATGRAIRAERVVAL